MANLSSHQFKSIYEDLGVDTDKLGCIMLDVEQLMISDIIDEDHFYYSDDEDSFVKGNVSEDVPHITLLYGLMESGQTWKEHVDTLLADWQLPAIKITKVDYFESQNPDEPYYCLVAKVDPTHLSEANGRLRFLPHIDTFPDYKPHITLAYIVKDTILRDSYLDMLNTRFAGTEVLPGPINYGK